MKKVLIALLLITQAAPAATCRWVHIVGQGDIQVCDEQHPEDYNEIRVLGYPKCIYTKIHDGTSYRWIKRCSE